MYKLLLHVREFSFNLPMGFSGCW